MLSIARIRGPLIMAIFPLQKYTTHVKSVNEPADTPMERIKRIFVSNQFEPMSKELRMLITVSATGGIVGFLVGGMIHTKGTIQKFIDNNMATRFYSHYDAQKQLHHSLSLQFVKGGLKLGWRTTLFTAILGSVQLLLTAYYGQPSVWHYVTGGGISGFLFKMSLGIRGSLVGLIIGGILGGIGGSISLLLLKLTGLSLEDLQNLNQEWALSKEKYYQDLMAQNMADEFKEAQLLYNENKNIQEQLSLQEEKDKKQKN